ncbi:hypothetical protein [Bradyrhizobium japonicum]|uniref:hypothetical protein n=1 Tax=Bradyrhizobium japonicum TaxID=375 RepID=UPI0020A0C334|nr:hypothetical protein [Bradyrhizobium japonicum]MCP1766331.1 hypothetical protein [Bradyrhizobium japonicum]MCP1788469.1 hypothetical protein [Bradyrhizobium japonicum]MCP1810344.1 hypothetical protein [Bradyrhizobium japonicum]MCP1819278.1 hypothetical protein [Bradyrhizobium japonicum]MCP1869212.1 hypothetical protein [Bradyrhizobium japonicum]
MAALRKPSHEIVAQALASGKTQADAYRAGGYTFQPANAHRLCTSRAVTHRVQEIIAERVAQEARVRELAIEKAALTDSWIIIRLRHTIDMAIRGLPVYDKHGRQLTAPDGTPIFRPDLAQANSGLRTAAQIQGMLVKRHEIGEPGQFTRMTDRELEISLIEASKALGFSDKAVQDALTAKAITIDEHDSRRSYVGERNEK